MEIGRNVVLVTVVAVLLSTAEMASSQNNSTIPVITKHPIGSIGIVGDTVSLSCAAEGGVHLIEWFRNGNKVGSGTQHAIAMLDEDNTGNYTCRAKVNGVGSVTSAIAKVELATITASPPGALANPHTHTVTVNHPTTLDCGEVVSTPPSHYTWSTQPDLFSNYDIIKGLDGLLYFPLVTQELVDEGLVFICQASNIELGNFVAGFIRLSTENNLSGSSPRVMLALPQDVVVPLGDSAFFQCIIGGSPLATSSDISWTFPTPGISHRLLDDNTNLYIRRVSLDHAGTYSCNATDLGVFSATLTVLVPPVISVVPEPLYTPVFGDQLSITCHSNNTLVSEWIWYHDGDRLSDSDLFTSTTTDTLMIPSAHNNRHDGLYQCFAYNAAGNHSATTSVEVITYPATLRAVPTPTSQLLFEGNQTSFRCVAHGAPPPSFVWLHNGAELMAEEEVVNSETRETTSDLVLSDLSVGDSGVYTCRAVNEVDRMQLGIQEAEATLEVIIPTNVTKPSLSQPILKLEQERTATIHCLAEAQEGVALNFTWLKDNVPLTYDGSRMSLEVGESSATVEIASVEEGDDGIYQCQVVSLYRGLVGPTAESAHLRVSTTPKLLIPPEVLPVTKITSSSFRVQWYFPGQDSLVKLTSYTVSYRELGTTQPIYEFDREVNGENYIIISSSSDSPVKPYTAYNVTVAANYKTGEVLSSSVEVRTSEDTPGPPGGVTGTVVNVTTVLLSWQPPADPNGIITNYTVRYKQASSQSFFITIPLASNSTSHHLSPLLQRAVYLVEVAASTSVGLGAYSEAITVSTDRSRGEKKGPPVYEEVWFIVVMFVVGLVIVIAGLLVVFGIRYATTNHTKQKYNVQSKLEMENKRNGHSTRSLTEDDMKDYNGRGSRLNGENNNLGLLLDSQESESSAPDKYHYEPSLSTTSHISSQAPAYINPPPFQEAIKSLHAARLSPAYSGSTLDQAPPSTSYTLETTETESSFWADSKTRILVADQSPSPARSYQPSPLHASPPPPPIPTAHRPIAPLPPPPAPHSPEHKYASLSELDHRGIRAHQQIDRDEGRNISLTASPQTGYDSNGYNKLPSRPSSQQRMRFNSTPQSQQHRTTSPQSLTGATATGPSLLQYTASGAVGSSSQDVTSVFHTQYGSQTMTSSQANPLYMRSSSQNMKSNTAIGAGFRRGSGQPAHGPMRPKLAKTSSQPNFATFV